MHFHKFNNYVQTKNYVQTTTTILKNDVQKVTVNKVFKKYVVVKFYIR